MHVSVGLSAVSSLHTNATHFLSSSSASQPQLLHTRHNVPVQYMIGSIASTPTVKAKATPPGSSNAAATLRQSS